MKQNVRHAPHARRSSRGGGTKVPAPPVAAGTDENSADGIIHASDLAPLCSV